MELVHCVPKETETVCLENRVPVRNLNDVVISSELDLTRISPCNNDEADARLPLPCLDAAKTGAKDTP